MPNMVDIAVGKRVKHLRWLNGMTQEQLAEKIGVKFQQVQKYETGANRISASRLFYLSVSLNVPVSFFFEGVSGPPDAKRPPGFSEADNLYERGSVELLRAYRDLDADLRIYFLDLLKAMARRGREGELPEQKQPAQKSEAAEKTAPKSAEDGGKTVTKTATK